MEQNEGPKTNKQCVMLCFFSSPIPSKIQAGVDNMDNCSLNKNLGLENQNDQIYLDSSFKSKKDFYFSLSSW